MRFALAVAATLFAVAAWASDDEQRIGLEEAPLEDVWPTLSEPQLGDLDTMVARGEIRVLTSFTLGSYFIDQGEQRGTVFELSQILEEYVRKKVGADARRLKVTIIPVVKKGKGAELARVLKETAFSMTSSVEPHGFRLFEKAAAKLAYDHKKQEISIVLNGKSCGQAQKCKLEEEESIVALHMLDMTYIFSINRDTGQAKKLASYERDYKLKISRGATVLKWADSAIKINDKKHDWQESEEGIPYDYLPKKLNLEISGTTEDGNKVALKTSANPAAFIKR